jgi:hypothetical protein
MDVYIGFRRSLEVPKLQIHLEIISGHFMISAISMNRISCIFPFNNFHKSTNAFKRTGQSELPHYLKVTNELKTILYYVFFLDIG